MTSSPEQWAPDACTLPTAERPLRAAEFDALFAAAVRRVERPDPLHLRLILSDGDGADLEATVRDLTTRESECCSFFEFTIAARAGQVLLDIAVPAARVDVLDALAARVHR